MKIASTQILYKNHFPLEGTYVESWMNACLWKRKEKWSSKAGRTHRAMGTCQKDTGASVKGLTWAKLGII